MLKEFLLRHLQANELLNAALANKSKISRNGPIGNKGILLPSRIKDPGYSFAPNEIKALGAGLQTLLLNAAGDETAPRVPLPETRTAAAGAPRWPGGMVPRTEATVKTADPEYGILPEWVAIHLEPSYALSFLSRKATFFPKFQTVLKPSSSSLVSPLSWPKAMFQ